MRFTLLTASQDGPCHPEHALAALTGVLTPERLQQALAAAGVHTQRERKLPFEAVLWLVIGMSLFATVSIPAVWDRLIAGLRLLRLKSPARALTVVTPGALCSRRYALGVRPLRHLFRRVCRPLATPTTRGAFLGPFRLMACDGHFHDVPDSPANARAFGRPTGGRGDSAFPQVLGMYLCECGTHAVVDAQFGPCTQSEHQLVRHLLRSVDKGMLVMWDRGIQSADWVRAVQARGAQVLARLSASVKPKVLQPLGDGSLLVELRPAARDRRRRRGGCVRVRLIEYTLDDPVRNPEGHHIRLVTTLLDAQQYPAALLGQTYHERWEEELVFDEQDTHLREQHHPSAPLRSRKPRGVIQELYGMCLAHYLVRHLMHEAAQEAGLDPDRLSFVRAVRVVQEAVKDFQIAARKCWRALAQQLREDLRRELLPPRRRRRCPREVKRKVLKWPLKRWDPAPDAPAAPAATAGSEVLLCPI